MARRRPWRQQRRDRISELLADILDKILGFLPIEEAARTAVLSTFWRDIWFSLTQLNFDARSFYHIKKKYSHAHSDIWTQNIQEEMKNTDIWTSAGLYVINKVLIQHNGLIRTFVLNFQYPSRNTLRSLSFDIYQWLLFVTQKGVEEIHLSLMPEDEYINGIPEDVYRLPNCILSCLTLRKLHLCGVSVNDPCILPNVTSLCFEHVDFNPRNHPADVPMLKNLSFITCGNIFNFTLDLRSICTLDLDLYSLQESRRGLRLLPPALNVEYLKLSNNHEGWDLSCSAFIHLMRICPKLRQLDIDIEVADMVSGCLNHDYDTKSKHLEEFCSVARTLKMLHTLKVSSFEGCETCMSLLKGLFSGFPELEKIVIIPVGGFNSNDVLQFMEELSQFPRASTKAFVLGQKRKLYNAENPVVYLLK